MGTLAAEVLGGAPLHVSPLGGHREPHHRVYRLQGWVASGQTTNKEGAQPHPSANNWVKVLLSPVFPTTNPSLQQAYTSLLASSTRGQTEEARAKILQAERKPHHSKLIKMKRQRVMSQMKGQDKTSEKQLNEVEVGNLPEKIEFKIMIVKMTRISEKEWRRGKKCLPKT